MFWLIIIISATSPKELKLSRSVRESEIIFIMTALCCGAFAHLRSQSCRVKIFCKLHRLDSNLSHLGILTNQLMLSGDHLLYSRVIRCIRLYLQGKETSAKEPPNSELCALFRECGCHDASK